MRQKKLISKYTCMSTCSSFVLRGIRRTQGSPGPSRLPITDHHMLIIHNSLSFAIQDHVMFWAASTLAYFGFLRSAEFTIPSLSAFNPDIHLTIDDIAVDSHISPSCLQLTIKASKTVPFRKGCCLYIGLGRPPLCALSAIMNYLPLRGQSPPTTAWPVSWSLGFCFPVVSRFLGLC